uniref:Uncharacterized protein n=1 Tax=Fagus sylvatica TaxID=28930 RepID=A0A2N9H720_FAGSY
MVGAMAPIRPHGPVAGYRSVLRTFVSAFIASYEINLQMGDSNLNLILDILCKIYRGEESLCVQFWDKESFIDGPIRCLLCNLEGEFPFWTGTCSLFVIPLYNFLDKSVGISSLFEINSDSLVDNISQIVETHLPVHVPGVEGLFIPSKTRGHVLKVIGGNTALVRWEDVCFAFMEIGSLLHLPETGMTVTMEKNVWAVEIICTLVRNLSPNSSSAALMSMGVKILGKVLKCSPSHVAAVALKANIFDLVLETSICDIGGNSSSSGSWLLSGKLAKMLLIDCEQNDNDYPLAISGMVGIGFLRFAYWKYKVKYVRWKVTLKVLEVMKKCIMSVSYFERLGDIIRDLLLCDSSIHNALFRIICTTKQSLENLYSSRLFELMEIEGLQLAIGAVLDILFIMLSNFSKDVSSSLSVFHQAVLSCTTKPVPVAAAVTSLISYFRNPIDYTDWTLSFTVGEATLNVIAIKASIHLPCDHRLQVQNLTVQTFNNASVPASAQATFPYKFAVSKFLQPGTFDLVGTIIYEIGQSPYQNTFYNGTIEVLEAGGPLSIESVFLVTLASALLVLLVIWIRGQIQNLSKKTKRAPKVEVGTKTTDASLDEWLQVSGLCFTMTLNFHGNCCPVDSTKGWLASVSYLLFAPRGSTIIWGPFLMKWRSQI